MDEKYVIILAIDDQYGTELSLLLPNALPRDEAIEYVLKYIEDNKYEIFSSVDESMDEFYTSGNIKAGKYDTTYEFQLSGVSF